MIKLFLFILVVSIIILVIRLNTPEYEKCYTYMEDEGHAVFGCCSGFSGETSDTRYLSENCLTCPHFVKIDEKEEQND